MPRFNPTLYVPHRHRRLLSIRHPHPAVLCIARARILTVLLANPRQPIGLDGVAARLDVDAEEAGGVEAEDLVLDLVVQGSVLELVHELVGHAQAAQALDLALRAAAPDA